MAAPAIEVERWAERRRRTAELRDRRPFAREVLDFYGALLAVQEDAFHEASASRPEAGLVAAYIAELVLPVVADVTVAAGPEKLREAVSDRLGQGDAHQVVAAWISGEPQPAAETFLARASTTPVLEALGEEAAAAFPGARPARGCPRCGGAPQLSYFAPAAEDLASGPRLLLCSRCHASWGYARMTCPSCGEDSGSRLPIFSEEGTAAGERGSVIRGLPTGDERKPIAAVFPHMRIDACETCRHYLLNIDVANDSGAVPLVDELAAIPLDLYAREHGFSKITSNLMGF